MLSPCHVVALSRWWDPSQEEGSGWKYKFGRVISIPECAGMEGLLDRKCKWEAQRWGREGKCRWRNSQCRRPGDSALNPKEESALRRRGGLLLQSCCGIRMGTAKGPLGFVTGQSCYSGGARLPAEESRGEDPDMGKTETGIWRSVWRSAWSWGTLFCFFSGS